MQEFKQNYRMVSTDKDPRMSPGPIPCSKMDTLSSLHRLMSRRRGLNSRFEQPVPVLWHLYKKCFLMFRQNLSCSSLCPLPLFIALSITANIMAPSSLHLAFRYLCTLIRFPWIHLFSRLNSPRKEEDKEMRILYKYYIQHSCLWLSPFG